MIRTTWLLKLALLAILIFIMATPAYSGGFHASAQTINGSGSAHNLFQPGDLISVDFSAEEYASGSIDMEYLLIAIVPRNERLEKVTSEKVKKWQLFHLLLRDRRLGHSKPEEPGSLRFHLELTAPKLPGRYKLVYTRSPFFTTMPLNLDDQVGVLATSPETRFRFEFQKKDLLTLVDFEVSLAPKLGDRLTLYLQANGKSPVSAGVKGGRADHPLEISWKPGGNLDLSSDKVSYSYRLFPEDDGWTAWTKDTAVRYHFLQKGSHTFTAKARYEDGNRAIESQEARYDFTLKEHLVAKPSAEVLYKGSTTKQFNVGGEDVPATVEFDTVYAKSKALIVGVWQFDDKKFPIFPEDKIRKDITTIEDALKSNNFEVMTLFKQRLSRDEIATALEELVNSASENDRLFIYFSTHGFSDPRMPSDGYIATSDCEMDKPSVRCFRLGDIEQQARRALAAKARQVLIAVDSCFSGLGVITKSAQAPNLAKLGAAQGLFMMTAGMADQLAEIDPSLKMSTFTHYLSKGLKGAASVYDKNGVITLSELLVYVQYNVAQHTDSRQIPMLGRVSGNGEMLFRPRAN